MTGPNHLDLIKALDTVHEGYHADDAGKDVVAEKLIEEYGATEAVLLMASLAFGLSGMIAVADQMDICDVLKELKSHLAAEMS